MSGAEERGHGGHSHEPHGSGAGPTRLAVAFAITAAVLLAEVIGAVITGSLALIVDAAHVLTDAGGLAVALLAAVLMRRPSSTRRTWGYARAEVLAATAQAALLLAVGLFVLVDGIQRLVDPPAAAPEGIGIFAAIALVGNVASVVVLASSRDADMNMRAAFLEVVSDALGSVVVLIAALVIALTEWTRADAVAALVIGVLIAPRAIVLLRRTVDVLLESTPRGLDLDDVRAHLLEVPHVLAVHDLHATQISSSLPVLTAHVVVEERCFHDGHTPDLLDDLQQCVAEHFPIRFAHSTFQLEPPVHEGHELDTHP